MPLNGSGSASAAVGGSYPATASTLIEAGKFNVLIADLLTMLSTMVAKDGQTTTTARIPFASGISVDDIDEKTSNTGVDIDGVLLKDGAATLTGALKWGTGTNTFGLVVKRKTADESVTSSTTLQDDDHLTFAIAASEEWVVDVVLDVTGLLNTTGIKLAVNAPAGATVALTVSGVGAVGSAATTNSGTLRSTTIAAALDFTAAQWPNASNGFIHMHYWVLNGATPGNITVQFAQSTSSGTAITAAKGSKLVAYRVA